MKKLVLTIAAITMALGLSAQINLLNDGGFLYYPRTVLKYSPFFNHGLCKYKFFSFSL